MNTDAMRNALEDDDYCDRLAAQAMDRVAEQHGMHALELNTDIMAHHALRRALVRAALEALAAQQSVPVAEVVDPEDRGYVTNDQISVCLPVGTKLYDHARAETVPLADDHKGMRVDYSGLLKQSRGALERGMKEPALAEMLRQLQEHLTELGQRWYAGDTAVVDEILQLYCIEHDTREALKNVPQPEPTK